MKLLQFLIGSLILSAAPAFAQKFMETKNIQVVGTYTSSEKEVEKSREFNLKDQADLNRFQTELKNDRIMEPLTQALSNFLDEYKDEKEDELKSLISTFKAQSLKVTLHLEREETRSEGIAFNSCSVSLSMRTDVVSKLTEKLNKQVQLLRSISGNEVARLALEEGMGSIGLSGLKVKNEELFSSSYNSYDGSTTSTSESYSPNEEYVDSKDATICIDSMIDAKLGFFYVTALERAIDNLKTDLNSRIEKSLATLKNIEKKIREVREEKNSLTPVGQSNVDNSERSKEKELKDQPRLRKTLGSPTTQA